MRMQHTIKTVVECSGVGLHSGHRVNLRLLPAPVDTGINFARKTSKGVVPVRVCGDKVVGNQLCTAIGENGASIQTVEHLLSTLSGLGIDNLLVEIDSAELPILDGSAEPFVSLILQAGIEEQRRPQPTVRITRPVEVREDGRYIILRPSGNGSSASEALTISCTIRFDQPIPIHQTRRYAASPEAFVREIARARTFGFLHEVEALRSMGLARGGSLENAVVISESGVINREGLRYSDEFVRHKILDLLGDLALLGHPIAAQVEAYCPGHQLNTRLIAKVLESPGSWVMDNPYSPSVQPALSLAPELTA